MVKFKRPIVMKMCPIANSGLTSIRVLLSFCYKVYRQFSDIGESVLADSSQI